MAKENFRIKRGKKTTDVLLCHERVQYTIFSGKKKERKGTHSFGHWHGIIVIFFKTFFFPWSVLGKDVFLAWMECERNPFFVPTDTVCSITLFVPTGTVCSITLFVPTGTVCSITLFVFTKNTLPSIPSSLLMRKSFHSLIVERILMLSPHSQGTNKKLSVHLLKGKDWERKSLTRISDSDSKKDFWFRF